MPAPIARMFSMSIVSLIVLNAYLGPTYFSAPDSHGISTNGL